MAAVRTRGTSLHDLPESSEKRQDLQQVRLRERHIDRGRESPCTRPGPQADSLRPSEDLLAEIALLRDLVRRHPLELGSGTG